MLPVLSSRLSPPRLAAILATSALFGAISLASSGLVLAEENERNPGAVKLLATIPVPGAVKMKAFDISWVDADTQLYYLADRSNAASSEATAWARWTTSTNARSLARPSRT